MLPQLRHLQTLIHQPRDRRLRSFRATVGVNILDKPEKLEIKQLGLYRPANQVTEKSTLRFDLYRNNQIRYERNNQIFLRLVTFTFCLLQVFHLILHFRNQIPS